MIKKILNFLFILSCLNLMAETALTERPEIGLVLSGGGARGIAHVGVLKVLEEAGIEVDYISGTSMGSIVGGLYAIGYSVAELENIIMIQDWDELLLDVIPLQSIAMEEKAERDKFAGSFPIEKGKINLPVGLVAGQQIHSLLSELCLSAHHIEDFTNLPTPFCCIATDIETGEAVVLNEGFLPDAIRASMSIPSMFAPIEIDGIMMVDGGLIRNFPVSDAKAMGADLIIGVDVGTPLYPKSELNSLVKIMNQAISFQAVESTKKERKLCDLLIRPAVDNYSIMDFRKTRELIDLGEAAAREMLPELIALQESQSKFEKKIKPIPIKEFDKLYIHKTYVQGLRKVSKNLVLGKLGIDKDSWITPKQLTDAIERIYGSEYFEKVSYKLVPQENGVNLFVRVVEKTASNLNFGFHYDNDTDAKVLINTTFRNKLVMGSKLTIETELGKLLNSKFSYFIHTGWKPGFGFGTSLLRKEYDVPIYNENQQKAAIYNFRLDIGRFDFQTIYSNSICLGGAVEFRNSDLKPEIIQDNWLATDLDYQQLIYNGYFRMNTYDRNLYPRKGVNVLADLKYITELQHSLVEEGFLSEVRDPMTAYTFKMLVVDKISGNLHYNETVKFGSLKGVTDLQDDSFFYLGGVNEPEINIVPFAGYGFMSLSASNFALFSSHFYYEVKDDIFISLLANAAQLGKAWNDLFSEGNSYFGFAVKAGWLTPIGPLELSYSKGDGDPIYYVNIGYYY